MTRPASPLSERLAAVRRVAADYRPTASLADALAAFGSDVEGALSRTAGPRLRLRLTSIGAWLFAALARETGGAEAAYALVREAAAAERARAGAPGSYCGRAEAAARTAAGHPGGEPRAVAALAVARLGLALEALGNDVGSSPEGGRER